jgi:hypothetical protein
MTDTIQHLPAAARRVETGPVQFGDDWPGTFIQGQCALHYGGQLLSLAKKVLANPASSFDALFLAQAAGITGSLLVQCDCTGILRKLAEEVELDLQQVPEQLQKQKDANPS